MNILIFKLTQLHIIAIALTLHSIGYFYTVAHAASLRDRTTTTTVLVELLFRQDRSGCPWSSPPAWLTGVDNVVATAGDVHVFSPTLTT